MAWPCRSSSSRSAAADGEDRSMARTNQAWDWGVELRDEERSELELLRSTVVQLRTQLDQAHEALRGCRQRHQDASEALRQLAEARPGAAVAFGRRCENVSCCRSQRTRRGGAGSAARRVGGDHVQGGRGALDSHGPRTLFCWGRKGASGGVRQAPRMPASRGRPARDGDGTILQDM